MHARVPHPLFTGASIVLALALPSSAAILTDAIRTHYGISEMDIQGFSVVNLGDLNHDGIEDYAVGSPGWNWAAGRVDVYSGNTGNKLFYFEGFYGVSLTGLSIANAGDVNNDGTDDVVVGAPTRRIDDVALGEVYVLSGTNGAMIHTFTGLLPDGGFGWAVGSAGDVDGDGYADVAISTPFVQTGMIEIFSGLSGLPLRMITIGIMPIELGRAFVNIGDVNGDGFDELAIGAWKGNRVYIYDTHNNAVISTIYSEYESAFGWSVARVCDFNSDGIDDVIVGAPQGKVGGVAVGRAFVISSATSSILRHFHGQPNSGFGRSVGSMSDFDGDGVRDFAVASFDTGFGRVDVFSGATSAHTWAVSAGPGENFGNALDSIQDINGDGYSELIVGHPGIMQSDDTSGAVYLFSGGPPIPFFLGASYDYTVQGTNPIAVAVRDMNLDGNLDIVSLANNRISVLMNDGNGGFSEITSYSVGNATGMTVVDVDLDAYPDVLVSSFGTVAVKMYRNTGTSLVFAGGFTNSGLALAITSADFNNDGRPDLAVTDYMSSHVKIWMGKTANTNLLADRFVYKGAYPVGGAPSQIEAVHLNGDNKYDLAVLNKDSHTISVLSNQGGGKFTVRPTIALEGPPASMSFADFNGDGKHDLITMISGSNQVSIRNGKPSFAFAAPKFYNVSGQPRCVLACDVNNDQKPDFITGNWGQDAVSVRLKKSGGFEPPLTRATGLDPASIAVGDFNNDGNLDIATYNKTSRTVSVVWTESLN